MLLPSIFNENFADDIFNDFFDVPVTFKQVWNPGLTSGTSMMQTDVKESDKDFELDISLPGFKKEDIKAELKEGYLTINAEHAENKEEKEEGKYIRKERYTGHCSRSFYVGEEVTENDIRAKFENGVLTLSIPKKESEKKVEEKKLIAIEG
ncbi:MAG: Hsp20/alpha crystallin family protein [Lachnospiraceae bacterium]|nr:Hsp20/alpha crystallin family protein [Lachnospiraceae bacterium]